MYRKNNVLSILFTQSTHHNPIQGLVVQLLSHVQLFATPWTAALQVSLSFTGFLVLYYLIEFAQTHVH